MDQNIIQLMEQDHKKIRGLFEAIRKEVKKGDDADSTSCLKTFQDLRAAVIAHAESEEDALYAKFENDPNNGERDLKHFSFEGYEEHGLVDQLLKEVGGMGTVNDEWRAKMKVVADLLDHHIHEEEKNFFPEVKSRLDRDILQEMGSVYSREHDEILSQETKEGPMRRLA